MLLLDPIYQFQLDLYSNINSIEYIKNNVKKIYLSSIKDAKCPALLIKINNVINLSKYNFIIYEIVFEISFFTNTNQQHLVIRLADLVSKKLLNTNCFFNKSQVISFKANSLKFDQPNTLSVDKTSIIYNALLKKLNNL